MYCIGVLCFLDFMNKLNTSTDSPAGYMNEHTLNYDR